MENEALDVGEEAAEADLFTREDKKLEEEQRVLFGSTDVRRAVRERALADDIVRSSGLRRTHRATIKMGKQRYVEYSI